MSPCREVVVDRVGGWEVDRCNEEPGRLSSRAGFGLGLIVSTCAVLSLFSSCSFDSGSAIMESESVSLLGAGNGSVAGPLVIGSVGESFTVGREMYDWSPL